MEEVRNIDKRESVRTVTANSFVSAAGLDGISLKARKLLYIAISQCRRTDREFYEFRISAKEFADLMGVDVRDVYHAADSITDELMHGFIKSQSGTGRGGKPYFSKYSLFSKCEYKDSIIYFKLNPDLTDFLLELRKDFSKPLLSDFLKMRSPYSMEIWHLMQREMRSRIPGVMETIEFNLSVDEIRKVTGTQDKHRKMSDFKSRMFDKAIREIRENCGVVVTYTDLKEGRRIVGFHCQARNIFHFEESDLPPAKVEEVRAKAREMTEREKADYDRLTDGCEQLSLNF